MTAFDFDEQTYAEAAQEALTRPSDAAFWDEDLYVTHTLMFHTPDPSLTDEYADGHSNYRSILRDLGEQYPADVEAASVGHWTYSRFLCVKVRVLNEQGQVTDAFRAAYDAARALQDYPLYDDDDYNELRDELETAWLAEVARDLNVDPSVLHEALSDDRLQVEGGPGDFVLYADNNYRGNWQEREAAVAAVVAEYASK